MGKAPITTDDDRGDEEGEEVPGLGHQALGHRGEPEAEGQGEDGAAGDEQLAIGRDGAVTRGAPPAHAPREAHGAALDRAVLGGDDVLPGEGVLALQARVAARAARDRADDAPAPSASGSPFSRLKSRSPFSSVQTARPTLRPWPSSKPIASPRKPAAQPLAAREDDRPRDLDDGGRGPALDRDDLRAGPRPTRCPRTSATPRRAQAPAPAAAGTRAGQGEREAAGHQGRPAPHAGRPCPVMAAGSRTFAICSSLRIFFSRSSSRIPRPVFIASAASSVALS